jgi:hypothetical protein
VITEVNELDVAATHARQGSSYLIIAESAPKKVFMFDIPDYPSRL